MIPNHRLLRTLARSPRREVWQAEGPQGKVAAHIARDGGSLLPEADALRRVSHPAVVRLVDVDRAGSWMTTEWVEGMPADRWADGAAPEQVRALLPRIAEGLAAIHAAGLTHGDLSPGNVLVAADRSPRILDLEPRLGAEGGYTPAYAAPERLRGLPPDERTDLYGFGALAWRLLAGAPPFSPDQAAAIGPLRVLPPAPSALRPGLPGGLEDLVLALMAANPRARPRPAARLPELLQKAGATPPRPPTIGLSRAREALRSALVEVLAGRTAIVVLYGPTGSGRRTLIRECVRTGRREGLAALPLVKAADVERIREHAPGVVTVYDHASWCPAAIDTVSRLDRPVLLLVHADRPVPHAVRNGGRSVPMPPLDRQELARLVEALGADPTTVDELFQASAGRPGLVVQSLAASPGIAQGSVEQRVLAALAAGPRRLEEVAGQLGLSPHRLLDHLEPLLDRGQVLDLDGRLIGLGR